MTLTVGVITNPTSGSGRGNRWGREALASLAGRGLKVRDLTRGSWQGAYEAASRARRHLDALVVVGGDGMAHLGVQVAAGGRGRLPLGIVAAGSGNDAAVSYGLPVHDVEAACDRIMDGLAGDHADVDLGAITGPGVEEPDRPRYFACVLSAGIDAAVAAYGSNLTWPRGPLKYKVATFREIPRFRPYGVRITADGVSWDMKASLVAVANTPIFGGGLYATPHAAITDGMLDLVLAEDLGRMEIVRVFPKLRDGSHIHHPRLTERRVKEVVIEQTLDGATLPAAFADGELVGSEPLRVSVRPGALRVLGARVP